MQASLWAELFILQPSKSTLYVFSQLNDERFLIFSDWEQNVTKQSHSSIKAFVPTVPFLIILLGSFSVLHRHSTAYMESGSHFCLFITATQWERLSNMVALICLERRDGTLKWVQNCSHSKLAYRHWARVWLPCSTTLQ